MTRKRNAVTLLAELGGRALTESLPRTWWGAYSPLPEDGGLVHVIGSEVRAYVPDFARIDWSPGGYHAFGTSIVLSEAHIDTADISRSYGVGNLWLKKDQGVFIDSTRHTGIIWPYEAYVLRNNVDSLPTPIKRAGDSFFSWRASRFTKK